MPLTDIETVRLLIGDTDSTDQTLTDDQIQYFLDEAGSARGAAPLAADAAANVLAMRAVSEATGGMSVDLSRRAELYRQRAIDLATGTGAVAGCFVGGISQSEIEAERTDTSIPVRAFRSDLHGDGEAS